MGAAKGNADTAENGAALADTTMWRLLILCSLSLCLQKYTFVATGGLRGWHLGEASFMVGFLLTGLIALPGYFVYPKIILKVLFYLFWKRASVEESPLPIFFYSPENQGHGEFSLVIRGWGRRCLPPALAQLAWQLLALMRVTKGWAEVLFERLSMLPSVTLTVLSPMERE